MLFVETTFSVTVTEVNDVPVLTAGTVDDLAVAQNSGATPLGLSGVAYGPGGGADEIGQTLSYAVTGLPSAAFGQVLHSGGAPVVLGPTTLAELQGMQFSGSPGSRGGP